MEGQQMRRIFGAVAATVLAAIVALVTVKAHAPSGAIFTTVADGTEVNYNIYQSKFDVYLDGGPGPGAPQHAAGLDDGVYVFQVTDPSGKTLLSTDPVECRQFTVVDGVIESTAPSSCGHVTGLDVDHNATTVQLMPFNDTPNPGGEYKVWVTLLEDYVCNNNLSIVDCGPKKGGAAHGFVPRHSKTDNFKVRGGPREIDTRFRDSSWNFIDGLGITWTDPLGGSNVKWAYEDLSLDIHHEAHVEAVENGVHKIAIADQPGCSVGSVYVQGVSTGRSGPQIVSVLVDGNWTTDTVFVDVACH
jgi:hypothetical protein